MPISFVKFVPEINCAVTGSWDKTIKFWDTRQPNPAFKIDLPERFYSGDIRGTASVFGTADRKILAYDLSKPQQPVYNVDSPLKFQTRVVRLFHDNKGYAVGSIEGRVAIQYFDKNVNQNSNFAFKCHRINNDIYAVNDIAFNHLGTFSTMGSDGTLHFWDKDSRQRLKAFTRAPLPVLCGAFNSGGNLFAYAVGYDWSKGAQEYNQQAQQNNHIFIHGVQQAEITPRKK